MFGIFKKKVTPHEFGAGIIHLAGDFLASDAGRSLGTRFENFDGSRGWPRFLEEMGVSVAIQKLYFHLYLHSALQAICTPLTGDMRLAITQGAMGGFKNNPKGYDFDTTFEALEAIYRGSYKFDEPLDTLANPDAKVKFLPNPNVAVLNAKYLIEIFVMQYMNNVSLFVDDFKYYSSTIFASIATAQRAGNHLSKSLRFQ